MTKAEILKKEILGQYRSVRQFALEMNIPYSTLVTALERVHRHDVRWLFLASDLLAPKKGVSFAILPFHTTCLA